MTEHNETHLTSSERQPVSFMDAKMSKELLLARKALSFHKTWVEILTGEVARLESGILPIVNGVRNKPPTDLPPAS